MKNPFSLNPVALRELRQLVRSKIITVGLAVFPAILFVFTMLAVSKAVGMKSREAIAFGDGLASGPFAMVSVITGIVACLGIPFYSAMKAIMETKRNGTGLEFTTALTPADIVGGRLAATAILTGATVATASPFFIFAYLLRGIPLEQVFLVPFCLFACGLSFFAVSLAIACRPGAVALRVITTVLLFFLMFVFSLIPSVEFSISSGSEPPPAAAIAIGAGAVLAAILVFFRAYCASLLAPPHVDGERPFRRVVFALFLLSSPLAFRSFAAWSIAWVVVSGLLLMMAALSPREIPRAAKGSAPRGFFRRMLALPFTTGAEPGMLFSTSLLCAAGLVYSIFEKESDNILRLWAIVAELTFAPILVGAVLRTRNALPGTYRRAGWAMIALLVFVSITSFMAEIDAIGNHAGEMMPCNFVGISENPEKHFRTYGALLLVSLVVVVASSISAFRKYRRPQ